MRRVKVFEYDERVDAFVVGAIFEQLSDDLGLTEWSPVVWIGRLFTMDNDFGEHWFDNWDERDEREGPASELGIDTQDLLIVKPERFADRRDGPCNTPELRKRFWTDVLDSLSLSPELLFDKARAVNERRREHPEWGEAPIGDLPSRIERWRKRLARDGR